MQGADLAVLAANACCGVPQAVVVWIRVAGTLTFVEQIAALQARTLIRTPPASCHLRAVCRCVVLIAAIAASSAVDIPLALLADVGIAAVTRVVAIWATVPAVATEVLVAAVGNPLAHRGSNAILAVDDGAAKALAGTIVGVPLAVDVGCAWARHLVLVVTAEEARRGVKIAHG